MLLIVEIAVHMQLRSNDQDVVRIPLQSDYSMCVFVNGLHL